MNTKRQIITITNGGIITIPTDVRMTIGEISDLFGIFYQTAKKNIRIIEKSGIATGDYSMDGTVERRSISPDYYGLEMIIAVAFRVQSEKTEIFRKWIIEKVINQNVTNSSVFFLQDVMLN